MPTYEYKCDACGNLFEKFQPITSEPIKKCPKCGKNKAHRLISAGAGLIFKGSGFYITDYRDKGYSDKAKADTESGGKTESTEKKESTSSTGSSDSTPAEKPAAKTESAPAPAAPAKKSRSEKKSGKD